MQKYDLTALEMLSCIYEDLDIDKIEERFVSLVNDVFAFDRIALFFVKHKKEALQGKLSKGFDAAVIRELAMPIRGDALLVKPLVTGLPLRGGPAESDPFTRLLKLENFALIPIVNRKRVACWEVKGCRADACPAHGKRWLRCWLVPGTKCSNGSDVSPQEKAVLCSACSIFTSRNLDTVEGVMLVDNSLSRKPVSDDVITILSIIAHTVGLAINNSKLYKKSLDEAVRDDLTGLHNRRYFNERLMDEVERAGKYHEGLSFILCDIDRFKNVNDTHGHPVGDAVLRWVADKLKGALRKNDVLSRYGGEEFALLLSNTEKAQARAIAEKLRCAIAERPFRDADREIAITLSFGIAALGIDSHSFEGLISCADKALYCAKANGRNVVCML